MTDRFDVSSTSRDSAVVEDIPLDPPDAASRTRRVMRATIVRNQRNEDEPVKVSLIHQRRHSSSEPWHDVDTFNLATLKAGQEVRMHLSAAETKTLYVKLAALYAVASDGVPRGDKRLVVLDDDDPSIIRGRARELIEQYGEGFWDIVDELRPDLLTAVVLKKQYEVRSQVTEQFQNALSNSTWSEADWQSFFASNTWIFGHGLSYQFLNQITPQPDYGGATVHGSGMQRGDYLMATEAEIRFTVLVEIKTPASPLVSNYLKTSEEV